MLSLMSRRTKANRGAPGLPRNPQPDKQRTFAGGPTDATDDGFGTISTASTKRTSNSSSNVRKTSGIVPLQVTDNKESMSPTRRKETADDVDGATIKRLVDQVEELRRAQASWMYRQDSEVEVLRNQLRERELELLARERTIQQLSQQQMEQHATVRAQGRYGDGGDDGYYSDDLEDEDEEDGNGFADYVSAIPAMLEDGMNGSITAFRRRMSSLSGGGRRRRQQNGGGPQHLRRRDRSSRNSSNSWYRGQQQQTCGCYGLRWAEWVQLILVVTLVVHYWTSFRSLHRMSAASVVNSASTTGKPPVSSPSSFGSGGLGSSPDDRPPPRSAGAKSGELNPFQNVSPAAMELLLNLPMNTSDVSEATTTNATNSTTTTAKNATVIPPSLLQMGDRVMEAVMARHKCIARIRERHDTLLSPYLRYVNASGVPRQVLLVGKFSAIEKLLYSLLQLMDWRSAAFKLIGSLSLLSSLSCIVATTRSSVSQERRRPHDLAGRTRVFAAEGIREWRGRVGISARYVGDRRAVQVLPGGRLREGVQGGFGNAISSAGGAAGGPLAWWR